MLALLELWDPPFCWTESRNRRHHLPTSPERPRLDRNTMTDKPNYFNISFTKEQVIDALKRGYPQMFPRNSVTITYVGDFDQDGGAIQMIEQIMLLGHVDSDNEPF